ncbi:hypothetical protein IQ243_26345 [Nostocales cyanobacterium LEGE 11386]|nr:hypothetical protein [Nostocales cyanobacterium LEGE 11386]
MSRVEQPRDRQQRWQDGVCLDSTLLNRHFQIHQFGYRLNQCSEGHGCDLLPQIVKPIGISHVAQLSKFSVVLDTTRKRTFNP